MTDETVMPRRGEKVRIPASGSTGTVIGRGRAGLLLVQVEQSGEMVWVKPGDAAVIVPWFERGRDALAGQGAKDEPPASASPLGSSAAAGRAAHGSTGSGNLGPSASAHESSISEVRGSTLGPIPGAGAPPRIRPPEGAGAVPVRGVSAWVHPAARRAGQREGS